LAFYIGSEKQLLVVVKRGIITADVPSRALRSRFM